MKDRLIFITNDDGFNSLGIRRIIEVAKEFGRVVVIAPEKVQSGQSHSITLYDPLSIRNISKGDDIEIYACNGTPADCVKMAFDHLLIGQKVDLVISGINHGTNASINVVYSGTLAAAIEGSLYGCPSVGFSLEDDDVNADFTASQHYCKKIITSIFENNLPEPTCLNVNIPKGELGRIKGIKVSRQCNGIWKEEFASYQNPRKAYYYWLTGYFVNEEPLAEGTDLWALSQGYVSIMPVQIDLTNYKQMSYFQEIFK